MSYLDRDFSYRTQHEKTVELIGDGVWCGTLYGAYADGGAQPRFEAVDTGYTVGFEEASAGFAAKDGTIFLVSGGGLWCKAAEDTAFVLIADGLARTPYFAEHSGGVLISDGATDYTYSGGTLTSKETSVPIYAAVIHYGRLFGADLSDGYTVRWTAAGTIDDYTEGLRYSGWLTLSPKRGKILQLVPYNDKLIAVRENGLSVIRVYGETENFRVSGTDTDTDSIYGGSAAVCADKLFFSAYSGLYAYDGSDISRQAKKAECALNGLNVAAACGNRYFCATSIDGDDVVACIDGESGETSLCGIAADCIFARGVAYVFSGGRLYTLGYPSQNIVWKGSYTSLGTAGKKYLKGVYISCKEGCTLTVENGVTSHIFNDVNGYVDVKMSGYKFRFTLSATDRVSLEAAYLY